MRWVPIGLLSVLVVVTGSMVSGEGRPRRADLTLTATGADRSGDPMAVACDLLFASVPSNLFRGQCRATVGPDHVMIGGSAMDAQKLLSVVLNGRLTVRGVAEEGSGRFAPSVEAMAQGFPLHLHIDPLAREWAIRADLPEGARTLASGALSDGTIVLVMP